MIFLRQSAVPYAALAVSPNSFTLSLAALVAVSPKSFTLSMAVNLGDANEKRDWRIYRDFANTLIAQARRLYADDAFAVDLDNSVYALDTTTIDLSLKVFPWAHFRTTKAAVKMHTQIDLRGNIPSVCRRAARIAPGDAPGAQTAALAGLLRLRR